MNQEITISKEKRLEMIGKIKSFFLDEREEEIGDLQAGILLDFVVDELGVDFYNQGIEDSYKYMNDKVADILGLKK